MDFFDFVFSASSLLKEFQNPNRLSSKWIQMLDDQVETVYYAAKQVLLGENQIPNQIIFLKKGAARGYMYNEQARECCLYLWSAPAIVTDVISYEKKCASDIQIEVSESSECLMISRNAIDNVIKIYPEASDFTRSMLLGIAQYHRQRDKQYTITDSMTMLHSLEQMHQKIYLHFSREQISSHIGKSRSWLHSQKAKKQ